MTLHTYNTRPMSLLNINFQSPYGFQNIVQTRHYRSTSLQQGQRLNQSHTMTFYIYNPSQCPYQVPTSYTLWFLRYSPDKIFKLKVTTARSKVKSRSDHDVAHLHPLTNVPTKYQLPTLYGSEIQARQTFSHRPPARPPIRTPWVKTIPQQPLRAVG